MAERSIESRTARGYDRLRIFDVLLATGARIGEVLALTWDDIHGLDGDGPVTVYIGNRLDKKSHRAQGRRRALHRHDPGVRSRDAARARPAEARTSQRPMSAPAGGRSAARTSSRLCRTRSTSPSSPR